MIKLYAPKARNWKPSERSRNESSSEGHWVTATICSLKRMSQCSCCR